MTLKSQNWELTQISLLLFFWAHKPKDVHKVLSNSEKCNNIDDYYREIIQIFMVPLLEYYIIIIKNIILIKNMVIGIAGEQCDVDNFLKWDLKLLYKFDDWKEVDKSDKQIKGQVMIVFVVIHFYARLQWCRPRSGWLVDLYFEKIMAFRNERQPILVVFLTRM